MANLVKTLALAIVAAHEGNRYRVRELCLKCIGAIPPDEETDSLLRAGKFIDAIKLHRATYGTTLKKAKDVCDVRRAELTEQRPW